jgi:hypothetical protein
MTRTTVQLPFGEGYLCHCGEIWRAEDAAESCGHVPGIGRRVPVRGDRWRRARLRHRYAPSEVLALWLLVGLALTYAVLFVGYVLA